ncbi:hypothetical protein [Methanobacterium paludis]|uniref:Uncharacterized protein n=1 Tax=Methanobacterium paludis (strain DSM 25820 / JCM 18151 / SWAN1) TaxID=868131 RepID=F6D2S9_METPW|nr:hypothetical protein [Methanobacterium paludis]AEG18658.1 hypothetical protein MSWAN_1647 [Methanobacterium paludis]
MEPINAQKISGIIALISAFVIVLMNAVGSYGYVIDSIVHNMPPEYQLVGSIVVWLVFIFAILAQWISSIKINDENNLLQAQLTSERLDKEKAVNKLIKMLDEPMGEYKVAGVFRKIAEKRKE